MSMFFTCLGLIIPFAAWAQNNPAITGNIIDEASGEPVAFANVSLYDPGKEQPLTGTFTDESGRFSIEGVEAGQYDLLVQFVGYDNIRKEGVQVGAGSVDIGTIRMTSGATELEEVIVQGEAMKRPVETTLEGLTIQPERNLSNIGGSVTDVLRNSPSVTVDQDGGISIRGSSSTNILINGRNSALAEGLDQIPASAIESIEVINNPGARYDAQGTGGVLNIKLKQGEPDLLGTNGRAELTLGNRYRTNTAFSLNHRGNYYNVFGGYSYRRDPSIGYAETNRTVYGNDPQQISQDRDVSRDNNSHTLNYGLDYYIKKNKFSYEGVFESEAENDRETTYSRIFDVDDNLSMDNVRDNRETEKGYTLDNSLIYERMFSQKNREFRALISHSYRDNLETQNTFTRPLTNENEELLRQRADTDAKRENIVLQADYVHPLERGKFEAGYKSVFRNLDNNYTFENYNQETDNWVVNPGVSNRFQYQEQVHALYAIYQHSFSKLDISIGTRLEQTLIDTKLFNTGEENRQRYINPFPSIQALYRLTDQQSLKFTYSRRIDRPRSRSLNPFPDIADTLNIRQGNPQLLPEFIQSLEAGHKINFKNADLTTNAFYRFTNNKVDYILSVGENGVSVGMPQNLLSSTDYGMEFIGTATINSWWDVNGSVTVFRSMVDGSNINQRYTNASFAWNTKLVSNMVLPWNMSFQLTANYESPEVEAQGFDFARYYVDMSFQRKIFNGKGSLNASIRDVFNTYRFGGRNETDEFVSTFIFKGDTRRAYLSLVYNF